MEIDAGAATPMVDVTLAATATAASAAAARLASMMCLATIGMIGSWSKREASAGLEQTADTDLAHCVR